MPKRIVTELTDEQKAMLASYRDKWKAISVEVEPIDRDRVAAVIKAAYAVSKFPEPEIVFFSNPFAAIKGILATKDRDKYLGRNLDCKFSKRVMEHLIDLMKQQIDKPLFIKLRNEVQFPDFYNPLDRYNTSFPYFPMGIVECVRHQIAKDCRESKLEDSEFSRLLTYLTRPASWSIWGCMLDFGISVLGLQHDRHLWRSLRELMQYSGFIFQFENVCIACDRPNLLLFDENNFLHAESQPALTFPDGYRVYAWHGGDIPEGRRCQSDEYIELGTRVKLTGTGEYGIVVYCWYSQEISDFDCYIAFFGDSFPDRQSDRKPYILRYAAVSLEILE